ncbi:hypothetical protein SAMN05216223_104445 [Actinacidiphila yanglinensis]|uniref:Uncharacterized protein n=1 Tax=Actinacidiphila yanglinensis TaxID=310779 RepID=A0A1H5ZFG9_9ACTN|nr:hypothetical protein SAMN05216223_104445 [Actinacidiphila yanglinensis]
MRSRPRRTRLRPYCAAPPARSARHWAWLLLRFPPELPAENGWGPVAVPRPRHRTPPLEGRPGRPPLRPGVEGPPLPDLRSAQALSPADLPGSFVTRRLVSPPARDREASLEIPVLAGRRVPWTRRTGLPPRPSRQRVAAVCAGESSQAFLRPCRRRGSVGRGGARRVAGCRAQVRPALPWCAPGGACKRQGERRELGIACWSTARGGRKNRPRSGRCFHDRAVSATPFKPLWKTRALVENGSSIGAKGDCGH